MAVRLATLILLAGAALLAGCGEENGGPVAISAIGGAPRLVNPSREPLDPPSVAPAVSVL